MSWTRVVGIDTEAEVVHAIHHAADARQVAAFSHLEDSLRSAGALDMASGLASVRVQAPQVLASAYAAQWLVAALRAVRGADLAALDRCRRRWRRFEAGAAVLSGAEWSGILAAADGRGCVVLPATGLVAHVREVGELSVSGGRVSTDCSSLPSCGAVTLDIHDELLRSPALDKFDFPSCALEHECFAELHEALALAEVACPGFADRFITTVVPVDSSPGLARAGTDESARLVTYCSFGRTPTDLLAALCHEEAHAVVNTYISVTGEQLPEGKGVMSVPWREGLRPLPAVLHGLAAFGRAATIRGRCRFAGISRPEDDRMGAIERSWVEEVSVQVLGGALGPLPADVAEWIERNRDALVTVAPNTAGSAAPELAAAAAPGFGFGWWLLDGGLGPAAASAYRTLRSGHWLRRTTDFYAQDVRDLSHTADAWPLGARLFEEVVPRFLRDFADASVAMCKLEAHRLRLGDTISVHTDSAQDDLLFRAVLNVTPGEVDGGQLQLWSHGRASLAALLGSGSLLVFEIGDQSFHEVTPNRDRRDRLTVVASYRRV